MGNIFNDYKEYCTFYYCSALCARCTSGNQHTYALIVLQWWFCERRSYMVKETMANRNTRQDHLLNACSLLVATQKVYRHNGPQDSNKMEANSMIMWYDTIVFRTGRLHFFCKKWRLKFLKVNGFILSLQCFSYESRAGYRSLTSPSHWE